MGERGDKAYLDSECMIHGECSDLEFMAGKQGHHHRKSIFTKDEWDGTDPMSGIISLRESRPFGSITISTFYKHPRGRNSVYTIWLRGLDCKGLRRHLGSQYSLKLLNKTRQCSTNL